MFLGPRSPRLRSYGRPAARPLNWCLPYAHAFQNPQRFADVPALSALGEVLLRAKRRHFFRHRHVDQLIDGDALGLRNPARLLQQRQRRLRHDSARPDGQGLTIDLVARLSEAFGFDDRESQIVDMEGVPVRVPTPSMLYRGSAREQLTLATGAGYRRGTALALPPLQDCVGQLHTGDGRALLSRPTRVPNRPAISCSMSRGRRPPPRPRHEPVRPDDRARTSRQRAACHAGLRAGWSSG
jgi:hypothetical protein